MAVIGSQNNNKDNSTNTIKDHLSRNRNFNINPSKIDNVVKDGAKIASPGVGLPQKIKAAKDIASNISSSKGKDLQNVSNIAKPKDAKSSFNPLKRSKIRRNTNNDSARPKKKNSLFNRFTKKDTEENNAYQEDTNQEEVGSEGQEVLDAIGKNIKKFIIRHPIVLVFAFLAFLLFLLFFIVINAVVGGKSLELGIEYSTEYGDFFAFDNTEIYILNENGTSPIGSRTVYISDYIKGIVYMETKSMDLSGLSFEQLKNFYTAIILVKKAQVLKKGNYSNKTKSISLKINDFRYCDVNYGCKLVSKNGKQFYLPNSIDYNVDSEIKKYDAMDSEKKEALNSAYAESVSKIIVPKSVNEPLVEYKWSLPSVNESTYSSWASRVKSGTKYDNLITSTFSDYKIYNLDNYVSQFESVYLSQYTLWWPIGSDELDATGLYSGDPASTSIDIEYGPSFANNIINKGMEIYGECGKTKVISMGDGVVKNIGSSNKYGKYVVINHEDGIQALYGTITNIRVREGQEVKAGTLLGVVSKYNDTTCGLYLEVHKNGVDVNPLDYISSDNPRVSKANYINFVQGSDNKQTVCKTLLSSGFNKNAVAGIMANIDNESGFSLNALSDGGTSNGLFQWHKGRLTNLKNYCGAEYLTSIKCQLDFFFYEITETPNAQNGIYNYLMGNHTAYNMGYEFCMRFERPSGGATSANKRGNLAANVYSKYVNNGCK